uniref:Uncharacterized protein n=1 Tax=Ditylenchus dipsaci TaxID=166011 RepID=A0A915EMW0_9BILA
MMDYSSTDEATTSEDDENSVERQQNLVARSLQFPRRRAKKRQGWLQTSLYREVMLTLSKHVNTREVSSVE